MKIIPQDKYVEIEGVCDLCDTIITFTRFENETSPYYDAVDIVSKWMDHQLSDCTPTDIDNACDIN